MMNVNEELKPVSSQQIGAIANMMENREVVSRKSRELVEDPSVQTRRQIIEGLKRDQIKGDAMVEWEDGQGTLRVNVIDFITRKTLKASDVQSGEIVQVQNKVIEDGFWRLMS